MNRKLSEGAKKKPPNSGKLKSDFG